MDIDENKLLPKEAIAIYNFNNITIKNSYNLSDTDLNKFTVPQKILSEKPFDIIIIDGPIGLYETDPGKLLPMFWSLKYLSKSGTIIYITSSNNELEKYGIERFFKNNIVEYFPERNKVTKIII